jgi:hypothetical protein
MARHIKLTVAANLARLRRERGMSQRRLAEHSDLATSMVAFLESGARQLVTSSCPRLAVGLGVQPHVLFMPWPHTPCPVCADRPPAPFVCPACRTSRPSITT